MLNDETIAKMIGASPPLVTDIDTSDFASKDAAIQPGSVDLSVGDIFRPKRSRWSKKKQDPRSEVVLKQGETAVIRSKEELNIPANVAAIAFPPARVSTKGLLMTNAGHVDPGYQGYLHLTVINMGKEDYVIRRNDRLVSLIFIKLNKAAGTDWITRRGGAVPTDSTLVDTAISSLSFDFLDVENRAKAEASKAVAKMTLWQFVLPLVASIAASILTVGIMSRDNSTELAKLEGRIGGLGGNVNLDSVEARLEKIEKKLGNK
jgi:deoxycytidine triphosphate deaminase